MKELIILSDTLQNKSDGIISDTINKVKIKGTEYSIIIINDRRSQYMDKLSDADGCCLGNMPTILIKCPELIFAYCDQSDTDTWRLSAVNRFNHTLRHEIVHAFFHESGLKVCAHTNQNKPYSQNEELVDWFAYNLPDIIKVLGELKISDRYVTNIGEYFKKK